MFNLFSEFPNDENGDVLRRMRKNGDDLSVARNIDFTVAFPNESAAQNFCKHFYELNFQTKIENSNCVPELPWDVVVINHMIPTHKDITAFEIELQDIAEKFSGRNDGWGCFNQKEN